MSSRLLLDNYAYFASTDYAGAALHSTPHKPTTSGKVSNTTTRESVDDYLAEDYKNNSFSGVSVRAFIEHVFGFDNEAVKIWEPRAENMIESCAEKIKAYRAVLVSSNEIDLYTPFVELANSVIEKSDELDPKGNPLGVKFHKYGNKYIQSRFGRRKPDVLTIPEGVDPKEPSWEQILLTWEFKKAAVKRRLEDDEDEDPGTSSKSKRLKFTIGKGSCDRQNSKEKSAALPAAAASSSSPLNISRTSAIGSSSKNTTSKSSKVQLTSYVAEMLSSYTFREWACGVSVDGHRMTLRYYDRTCSISTLPFSYTEEHLVDFLLLLMAIRACEYSKFGYSDMFVNLDSPKSSTLIGSTLKIPHPMNQIPDDSVPRMNWKGDESIKFEGNIHSTYSVFGRATVVYRVNVGCMMGTKWENRSEEEKLVIKIGWQVKTRKAEDEIIRLARKIEPDHTPAMFIAFTRDRALPSDKMRDFCGEKGSYWEARSLRFIVFRCYIPLYELKGEEYLEAFIEIVICMYIQLEWSNSKLSLLGHWTLYDEGNILHRDLSIYNLMFERRGGRIVGILNDYDLAVVLNNDKSLPPRSSNHRTGTAAFMAHELLDIDSMVEHSYRHDLESFFYVLFWTAVGYKGSRPPEGKGKDLLYDWRKKDWFSISKSKLHFLSVYEYYMAKADHITDDYIILGGLLRKFYSILQKATAAATITFNEYIEQWDDVIGACREKEKLLNSRISWERVKHLFERRSERASRQS